MLNIQVLSKDSAFVPFPKGSFKQVMAYADFVGPATPGTLRLAVHSATKGYTTHVVSLTTTAPSVLPFVATDVDAVSIVNEGTHQVGVTFS